MLPRIQVGPALRRLVVSRATAIPHQALTKRWSRSPKLHWTPDWSPCSTGNLKEEEQALEVVQLGHCQQAPRLGNALGWSGVAPCWRVIINQTSRGFSTAADHATRQMGTPTPNIPQNKGSASHLVKVGIGSATLLAVVAAYFFIERPENFTFWEKQLIKRPVDANGKDGKAVGVSNGHYKVTGSENENAPNGKENLFESTHIGDKGFEDNIQEESKKGVGSDKENAPNTREGLVESMHIGDKGFEASNQEVSKKGVVSEILSQRVEHYTEVQPSQEINASVHGEMPTNHLGGKKVENAEKTIEVQTGEFTSMNEDVKIDAGVVEGEDNGANEALLLHDVLDAELVEEDALLSQKTGGTEEGTHMQNPVRADGAFTFVELLHAAEQRQAEADARIYNEAKKTLKGKYEEELKDVRAKELMYAEEASRLEKELAKEKARAAVSLKLQQEEAEERLYKELKRKEEEWEAVLKESQLLAKAEIALAVGQEELAHLSDMKDTKIQIDALHNAFYAQSEEAHQYHTVHKLALGVFAMNDAMMRGAPVGKEIALLLQSVGGSGSDPLLDIAILSLSEEVINEGTKTCMQLHGKFEAMKGALRELSLIPAGGGGLLTHVFARAVSAVKVRENGGYSDGIEAVISQVDVHLGEGRLVDAANLLEKGIQGTKAEDLAAEWLKLARNRAVMEQALALLQAHVTAIASSLV